MSYYYMTKTGRFVESSRPIEEDGYIKINELEYAVTRLIMSGYTKDKILKAIEKVFQALAED